MTEEIKKWKRLHCDSKVEIIAQPQIMHSLGILFEYENMTYFDVFRDMWKITSWIQFEEYIDLRYIQMRDANFVPSAPGILILDPPNDLKAAAYNQGGYVLPGEGPCVIANDEIKNAILNNPEYPQDLRIEVGMLIEKKTEEIIRRIFYLKLTDGEIFEVSDNG